MNLPQVLRKLRDSDSACLRGFVTNSWAPTQEELGMQVGKQAYPSMDEANIDLKVVCDNS